MVLVQCVLAKYVESFIFFDAMNPDRRGFNLFAHAITIFSRIFLVEKDNDNTQRDGRQRFLVFLSDGSPDFRRRRSRRNAPCPLFIVVARVPST